MDQKRGADECDEDDGNDSHDDCDDVDANENCVLCGLFCYAMIAMMMGTTNVP